MEITKEYQKDELTIYWKPKKCIHSEICVKTLPGVYKPTEKPWIQPENASVEALKAQINQCPSGALTYSDANIGEAAPSNGVELNIVENGPILMSCDMVINHKDGTQESRSGKTALCRCGASENKPFCDGTHKSIGFVG